MTQSRWIQVNNQQTWDSFLLQNQQNSFLQSFQFGNFYQDLGYKIWRLASGTEQELTSAAMLVKLSTKLGNFLYCPGGPNILDWETDFPGFLDKATEIGKEEKVSFIRLDPRNVTEKQEKILVAKGLVKAANYTQPQCSQVLDLTQTLEEIKNNFSSSTRYNVGWVGRQGVTVEISQDQGEIEVFINLLKETARRQNFHLHAKEDYYKKQFQSLAEKNMAKLFITKAKTGEILAAAIVVNFGDTATYLHAASSSKNQKLRGPYLMQWKIIEDSKESGYKKYDFWGIAKDDNQSDPWAGVTAFKRSFGGEKVCYQTPYDLELSKTYLVERLIEKTRPVLKKLRI